MALPTPLYFLLASLLGMVFMVSRKIFQLKNGEAEYATNADTMGFDLEKIRHFVWRGVRNLGYITLFLSLRLFMKTSNFLKVKGKMLLQKIEDRFMRDEEKLMGGIVKNKEVSKYLRMISDYREKIRRMKHIIKEEEGIK